MSTKQTAPVIGVGAVVWKDGRVLLIRRGTPPRQGSWSLPGGRQELGETVEETAVREIREEAGIDIRLLGLVAVVDLIEREDGAVIRHYTVIDWQADWVSGEAIAGTDAAAVTWADPDALAPYELTPKLLEVIAKAAAMRKG